VQEVNVYDVLPDLVKANKVLREYVGAGAFHTGVVIHYKYCEPKEWAFGGCDDGTGVFCTEPRALDGSPFVFKQTLDMGRSVCEDDGIAALVAKLMDEWPGYSYDLTRRNCCHFSEALCTALGVDVAFPAWVNRLAGVGAAVSDAHARALLQAQQLDERYRIREQSGAVWLKARAKAAELDAKYRVKESAERAKAHVRQKLDESETVQRGIAKAKETASALDAKLGGLMGGGLLSGRACNLITAMQIGVQDRVGRGAVIDEMTAAARAQK
jgi:hypothetical protein